MNVKVNSGDGNSIFEIAAKFQQMQLREISKNIETIKQRLRSGEDTGSFKFIDDMDKLNGLILQLKVKTGFVISETIDEKVEENMDKLRSERDGQIVNLIQALKADSSSSSPTVLINTTLKAMKDDDIDEKYVKLVALKAYATSIKNTTALGKIDKELGNVFN